jgi:hypothetical protein
LPRHFWDFSKIFKFGPIFHQGQKKIPHYYPPTTQKKNFYAFASVLKKPEAAQKSGSGASFLSSNGHRNHQKQSVLRGNTEPGVTGGSMSRRGGQNIFFPTLPNKKIFLQKKSVAAGLMHKYVMQLHGFGKILFFFATTFLGFFENFQIWTHFSQRTKKNPPLQPPYNPKKKILCFCFRFVKTGGRPKIGLRSIFPQLKWTSEPSKTKRFAR